MDEKYLNGRGCPVGESWDDHIKKIDDLTNDVWKINLGIGQMQLLLAHMNQLPVIAAALTDIKDKTLKFALGGKDEALMRLFMKVVGVLLGVILSLVGIIGMLLVGEKFGLIERLVR